MAFLQYWVDSIRDTLPANRLYPMGQCMPLFIWDGGVACGGKTWQQNLQDSYNAGCTAVV